MKCTYCHKRCKAEDVRQMVSMGHRSKSVDVEWIQWLAPTFDDWLCPACQKLTADTIRAHLAGLNDIVLAVLREQEAAE